MPRWNRKEFDGWIVEVQIAGQWQRIVMMGRLFDGKRKAIRALDEWWAGLDPPDRPGNRLPRKFVRARRVRLEYVD